MSEAYAFFLKKRFTYLAVKTDAAWDAYTDAYFKWIDAVCDAVSAEHNERVLAKGGGAESEKSQK